MINIFINSITRTYLLSTILHNNWFTVHIIHNISLFISCISSLLILIDSFVTITIERTKRASLFNANSILTIFKGIRLRIHCFRQFGNFVRVTAQVNIGTNTPIFLFIQYTIDTGLPSFILHSSRVVPFILRESCSSRHFRFFLQQIFNIFIIPLKSQP